MSMNVSTTTAAYEMCIRDRGRDGIPITNNPPYGYIKDTEDNNRCDMSKPYEWAGVSVVRMLEKPEYMGAVSYTHLDVYKRQAEHF